ncbi:MAG TPA: DUF6445 family protein [Steroidobacteraceae bacterium]|jgi:hypothetical protein|nr:DUF6445 family protein [Steroidobacteraceae bacterium]
MIVRKLTVGAERFPLLVVDDFVANADELVDYAVTQTFTVQGRYYPGIRCVAPPRYQQFLLATLGSAMLECLGVARGSLRLSMCHFSIVTTPADRLELPQRIPHVDSLAKHGLASIHYLFRKDLGGTAFYRHRSTGFESIDESRNERYLRTLEAECAGALAPGPGYINGDTPLFEQIGRQDGIFNRLLLYPRNVLHSGCIAHDFVPDPDPRTGRLSINSFIDVLPG